MDLGYTEPVLQMSFNFMTLFYLEICDRCDPNGAPITKSLISPCYFQGQNDSNWHK